MQHTQQKENNNNKLKTITTLNIKAAQEKVRAKALVPVP